MVTTKQIKAVDRGIDQRLGELERQFTRSLNNFYNKYVKPLADFLPGDSIRKKYERTVFAMIRNMVQQAYGEGTAVVGKEIKKKNPGFFLFESKTDTANIDALTNQFVDRFWTTVGKLVTRQQDFIATPEGLIPKNPFEAPAAMIESAVHFVFSGFNEGIVSKVKIIGTVATEIEELAFLPRPTSRPPPGPGPGPGAAIPPEGPTHLLEIRQLEANLVFLTKEDEKVDKKICKPLNKTVYDASEPGLPQPPLHRHCRCILIPIVEAQARGVDIFHNDFI